MAHDRIRHLATSWDGDRLVAAAFEHRVSVWDIASQSKITEFETTLDFGGSRLAIAPDGGRVIVGAYDRHGIACYDAEDGYELWRRKDLKKVQDVTISRDGSLVWCGLNNGPLHQLELSSGITVARYRATNRITESPSAPIRFFDKSHPKPELCSSDGHILGRIERMTFAFLNTAFGPGFVLLSDSGGPVRCIDIKTMAPRWTYVPPAGSHVLTLSFNSLDSNCYGVEWPYQNGGSKRIVRFKTENGQAHFVAEIGDSAIEAFCKFGSRLVTWDGSIFDVASGKPIAKLGFPSVLD